MYKKFATKIMLLEDEFGEKNLCTILTKQKKKEITANEEDLQHNTSLTTEDVGYVYSTIESARVSIAKYKTRKTAPRPTTLKKIAARLKLHAKDFEDSVKPSEFVTKLRKNRGEVFIEDIFKNSINMFSPEVTQDYFFRHKGIYKATMFWIRPDPEDNPKEYILAKYNFLLRIHSFSIANNLILVEKTTSSHFRRYRKKLLGNKADLHTYDWTQYDWGWWGIMLPTSHDYSTMLLEKKDGDPRSSHLTTIHLMGSDYSNRDIINGLYIANPKNTNRINDIRPLTTGTRVLLKKFKHEKKDLTLDDYEWMSHEKCTKDDIDLNNPDLTHKDKFGFFSLTRQSE